MAIVDVRHCPMIGILACVKYLPDYLEVETLMAIDFTRSRTSVVPATVTEKVGLLRLRTTVPEDPDYLISK